LFSAPIGLLAQAGNTFLIPEEYKRKQQEEKDEKKRLWYVRLTYSIHPHLPSIASTCKPQTQKHVLTGSKTLKLINQNVQDLIRWLIFKIPKITSLQIFLRLKKNNNKTLFIENVQNTGKVLCPYHSKTYRSIENSTGKSAQIWTNFPSGQQTSKVQLSNINGFVSGVYG